MGLSGRKIKQRIPDDPRNLTWADDAARFGSNYLAKFGWDSSKGLGVEGEGRTSHVKVSHKLDMLGIGAAHQRDPDGIAWKQNKDFENLLRRLNANSAPEQGDNQEEGGEEKSEVQADSEDTSEKKKKRKRDGENGERDGDDEKKKKKKKKKNGDGKVEEVLSDKKKRSRVKDSAESKGEEEGVVVETLVATPAAPAKPYVPRHRAHRARHIAAKSIASKSAAAISEILGISPSPSSSGLNSGLGTPQEGKLTSLDDGTEKLTTSAKSMADYFKEKLLAKTSRRSSPAPAISAREIVDAKMDSYEPPRGGLGSSRLIVEVHTERSLDVNAQRVGLSSFSSLRSSSFLAASSLYTADPNAEPIQAKVVEVIEETTTKSEKKKSKKEKRKKSKETEKCSEGETKEERRERRRRDKAEKAKDKS